MPSIINASSTGSGGIVQTADASGVLQLQSNGNVVLTVGTGGTVSVGTANVGGTLNTTTTSGNWGEIIYDVANNTSMLQFRNNAGAASGSIVLSSAGATSILLTSVAGVEFPATQVASANANTLDDYEEGTFTPSITFGGNAVGITYGTRVGRYTKIGNCVTFNLYCPMTNKGSSTGIFNIIGLPFTSQNVSAGYNTFTLWTNNTNSTLSGVVQGYVTNGSTAVTFEFQASGFYGAMGGLTNTQCNNNSDFMVGGMYFV
jgi:hypothetical protein